MSYQVGPLYFPVVPADVQHVYVEDIFYQPVSLVVPAAVAADGGVTFTVASTGRYRVRVTSTDLQRQYFNVVDVNDITAFDVTNLTAEVSRARAAEAALAAAIAQIW